MDLVNKLANRYEWYWTAGYEHRRNYKIKIEMSCIKEINAYILNTLYA